MKNTLKRAAQYIKDAYLELGINERFVLISVIFVFIPVNVSSVTTAALLFYLMTYPENRAKIASVPRVKFLAAWAVLAMAAGISCGNFLGDSFFLFYVCFVAFSCFAFAVMTRRLCERFLQLILLLSWPCFIVAIVQMLIFPHVRPVSTFYNANYYGFICELLILAAIFGFTRYKTFRKYYVVSGIMNAAGLIISGCRSAWPAVLVGAIILFAVGGRKKDFFYAIVIGAAAAAVFLLHPSLIPRFDSLTSTKSLRVSIWSTAWDGFLKRPVIGGGFMRYWQISADLGHRMHQPHAHNMLLNALLCYGVAGVSLQMCFIVPAAASCIKRLKTRPECAMVLAAIAAIVAHGVTDDPILGMQTGIFAMLFMTLGGARPETPETQPVKISDGTCPQRHDAV